MPTNKKITAEYHIPWDWEYKSAQEIKERLKSLKKIGAHLIFNDTFPKELRSLIEEYYENRGKREIQRIR